MIQDARLELSEHPWQVFIPSLALVFTILAFNTLGDGIRDALGLGLPKGKQRIKGRLGLTTVEPRRLTRPAPPRRPTELLSEVPDLSVEFVTEQRARHRRRPRELLGVDAGEVVALVGESGSGKTVPSLAVMRLVASPPGRITSGSVLFDGRDLLDLSFNEMRELRGDRRSRWCSRTR